VAPYRYTRRMRHSGMRQKTVQSFEYDAFLLTSATSPQLTIYLGLVILFKVGIGNAFRVRWQAKALFEMLPVRTAPTWYLKSPICQPPPFAVKELYPSYFSCSSTRSFWFLVFIN
jgi:hypothetical protein